MKLTRILLFALVFFLFGCATPASPNPSVSATATLVPATTIANAVVTETLVAPTAVNTFTPIPTETPTVRAMPSQTPTSSPTRLVASPARSPLPTITPRPTLLPTETPIPATNLSAPGVPVNPIPDLHHYSDALDKTQAHLYTFQAHQRQVLVYIDDEGILDVNQEKAVADTCMNAWTRIWQIFGGYAYTTFECVASYRRRGAGSGITVGNSSLLDANYLKNSFLAVWMADLGMVNRDAYRGFITHEVFHSWGFGQLYFRDQWFVEGAASYYATYLQNYPERLLFLGSIKSYIEQRNAGRDRALSSITLKEPAGFAYIKGPLIFYMLDVEISERTQRQKSLDNVMRRLYLEQWQTAAPRALTPPAGLKPPWTSTTVFRDAIIAEAGNAEFFNAFFRDYVDGTRDLREWHNGLLKFDPTNLTLPFPPHPEIN